VSGRTILRWVQKCGPALAEAVRQYRKEAGHDVAGGRDLREDSGQMALPLSRR
jgi:hypothetical protein